MHPLLSSLSGLAVRARALPALCTLAIGCAAGSAQAQVVDVGVTQTLLGTPSAGGTASVRITVTNFGTVTVTNFQVIGGVVNAALNSVGGALAACAKGRNSVYTCNVPALAPGLSTDLLVSARVDNTATTFRSNAQTSTSGDSNFANNSSSVSTAVLTPPPDVQLSGSASSNSPAAGTTYSYRFQAKVAGTAAATDVALTAALPPELTALSAVTSLGSVCTLTVDAVNCALGTLAGGSSVDVTLTVVAPALPGTSYALTGVALAGDGRDANAANNAKTIDVTTR